MKTDAQLLALFEKVSGNSLSVDEAYALLANSQQQELSLSDKLDHAMRMFPENYKDEDIYDQTILLSCLIIEHLTQGARVSAQTPLSDLGIDSLMISSIADVFNTLFNITLSPTLFYEYATIQSFVTYLIQQHKEKLIPVYVSKKFTLKKSSLEIKVPSPTSFAKKDEFDELIAGAFENPVVKSSGSDFATAIMQFGAVTMDVKIIGKGSPLVFLGGLNTVYSDFAEHCERLASHHKVVFIELPGFGKSNLASKTDNNLPTFCRRVDRCLELIGVHQPFSLFGYSIGGIIAQYYAVLYPQRVDQLYLVCTSPYYKKLNNLFHEMFLSNNEIDKDFLLKKNLVMSHELLSYYDVFFGTLSLLTPQKIETSGLWIAGDQDPVSLFAKANNFQEIIPQFKIELIANAGHFLPWTHKELFYKALAL